MEQETFDQMKVGEVWNLKYTVEILGTVQLSIKILEIGVLAIDPEEGSTKLIGARFETVAVNGVTAVMQPDSPELFFSKETLNTATRLS